MKIKMSPNVAVRTDRYQEALAFYASVLGFENRSDDPDLGDFDASPLRMFVIEDSELRGLIHELFVDDLETARDMLVEAGCEVIRWRGKGQDCYLRDPFGVIYNLWEE
jgi:catechol 2,3-dioxygenase-like lactoylglutathione lyase family enzyme